MVIGTEKLLQLVKDKKLIDGLDKRELTNPEGTGFDLRVEKLFSLTSKTFLGITHRATPELLEVVSYKPKSRRQQIYTIKPGDYYLSKTIEKVNMPTNLLAIIKPRTTLYRGGLIMRTGFCTPGYKGDLYFGLHNAGNQPFDLEMGARYAHIVFFEISGDLIRSYQGQWQGGRATTKEHTAGLEKQI